MKLYIILLISLLGIGLKAQEYPIIQEKYEYDNCVFYKISVMDNNGTPANFKDDFKIGQGTLTDCLDTSKMYGEEDSIRLVILKIKYFDDAGSIAYKVGLYSGEGESFLNAFIRENAVREEGLEGQ